MTSYLNTNHSPIDSLIFKGLDEDLKPKSGFFEDVIHLFAGYGEDLDKKIAYLIIQRKEDIRYVNRRRSRMIDINSKLEQGLLELKSFKNDFNNKWATDYNGFFSSSATLLEKMRRYMEPLMKVLKQYCPKNLPTKHDMEVYNIKDRPVQEVSPLVGGAYSGYLYDVKEDFPMEVEELIEEIQKCYVLYEKCLHICKEIIEDEEKIKQSPVMAGALFEAYKSAAYSRFKNTYQLLTDEVFARLMKKCQAYKDFRSAESNEDFVCKGVHKYNTKDADNLIMILYRKGDKRTTGSNKKLWGDRPELAEDMPYIIGHFDELLPGGTEHNEFVLYVYALSKWANAKSVEKFTIFFSSLYNGDYGTPKSSSVYSKSSIYKKDSRQIKNFFSAISRLLANRKKAGLEVESA